MKEVKEESKKEKDGNRSSMSSIGSIFMHADAIDCGLMALGCIGAIGNGISLPFGLLLSGIMFNHIGSGLSSPNLVQNISHNTNLFLCLGAGSFVVSFLEGYCWTRTAARQASRMRVRYLKAVLRQDVGYFSLKVASTTEAVTSISNDSLLIQDFLCDKVPNFIMNSSTFIACYITAFILMWRLAVVICPLAVLLIIPSFIYGRVLLGLARTYQMKYNKASEIAEQAVTSICTVYAFTAEHRTMESFSAALKKSVQIGLQQGLYKGLAIGSTGITFAVWSFMVWYNSRLVMYHGAQGGTAYFTGLLIITGGASLGSGLSNIKYFGEAIATAERIKEVIDRKPAIDLESCEEEEIGEVEGEVEFKEVRFAYPARSDTEIFRGFNLKVPAGRTLALVGGSGSGKSTAIALLQRFYDPSHGEILLDGVDIKRLGLKWLRAQMGLVSQEPTLFATSIKENILFGREDATMAEVVAAAKVANATAFISQLPEGYDTQVGGRGVQLSGGQKQRIAIARAIIRSPKILLFDEATSALDSHSERLVQEAIDVAAADRTTIIIAHSLSTIRNADTIAFVQAGQVVESGSHDDLYRRPDGHYSSLVRFQESQPLHDTSTARARNRSRSSNISHSFSSSFSQHSFSNSNWSVVDNDAKHVKLKLPFWRLLKLNASEWRQAALGCIGAVLNGAVNPIYGFSVGSIASIYFLKDHDEMKNKTRTYALLIAALSVFCLLVNILQHFNFASMSENLTKRLREKAFSKMLMFEVGWFDQEENSTGALCSRLADASVVRSMVADWMSLVVQTFSAIAISYTVSLLIAWRLALVFLSVQPLVILCFYARFALLKSKSKKAMEAQLESSNLAAEAISNFHNVAAFSAQDRILRHFELAQVGPRREGIRQSWILGASLGSSQCINICVLALGFWYGGLLVFHGYISARDLFQTLAILMSTGRILAEACAMTTDITKGMSSIASVFQILDRSTRIDPDKPQGHKPKSIKGDVKLSNVEFAYPSRPDVQVLRQFSLTIKAGRSIALVGPSGCGKSTIIGLIERFYDPLHGVVYIDGKDIRSYNLRYLRRHLALVGQEPVLFAGTVRENITYGIEEGIGDVEVEEAARAANAHDFICSLGNGYQTSCGERGTQLSGGQKQRIAIARAILRNPRILLLDEATSALDGRSEKIIQEALESVMVGRTSVMVAHRLSTVKNCDAIAVLDKGVLVEKGSHSSLMAKGPIGKYYGLVSLKAEVTNNNTE